MKESNRKPDCIALSRTPVVNVSSYSQKLPNAIGDNIPELDVHFAQAPTRLTAMGVDLETIQASLIIMSSFTRKLGQWAQHNIEALYSILFVT